MSTPAYASVAYPGPYTGTSTRLTVLFGAGRVQNATSAASAMALGECHSLPHKNMHRDAATCPEHGAAIKLYAGVFEVMALAQYERERGRLWGRGSESGVK